MELIDEGLFDYSESANKLKKLIIKFSKNGIAYISRTNKRNDTKEKRICLS